MNQATVLYLLNEPKKQELAQQKTMTVLNDIEQLIRSLSDQILNLQEENALLRQLADHDPNGLPFSDSLNVEGGQWL